MNDVEQAILKTLIYADVFDYPLTLKEIHTYIIYPPDSNLPGGVPERQRRASPGVVEHDTRSLLKQRFIDFDHNYYFLPGRDKLVTLRKQRQHFAQPKLFKANTLAQSLARFPSVQGVFLTGALSMNNADETDDIDLLIITQANRLWVTRLGTTLYLEILGIRRRPEPLHPRGESSSHLGGGNADRICVNMWLDEIALSLPKSKRSLYTAHEVVQVKPLINVNYIYERFLQANRWVLDYLPNTDIPKMNFPSSVIGHPSSIFEPLAYHLQLAYMKHKMTRETISPHTAFFHPRDTSHQVLTQFQQRL